MSKNIIIIGGEPFSVFLEFYLNLLKFKKIKNPYILIHLKNY